MDGTLGAVTAGNGTNGSTVVNADNTVTYTPNANFNGTDSFTYTVVDNLGLVSNTATVTVTVSAVNDAPVAIDDTAGVQPNNTIVINVLANDTDNDIGDSKIVVSVSAVTGTAGGTVVVSNAGADVTYTASTGEGTVTFTYIMQDAAAVQSTATVTISVTANPSPVAAAGTLTVVEDSSNNTGTVSATDADPITYAIATNASSGTVSITDVNTGAYTYTPNSNFSGTDTFTFTANDGISDSAPETVTITVTAVNDAPTATAPTLTVAEDATVAGTSQITVLDADTSDTHTYAINTQGSNGVASVSASGLVSYAPSTLNYSGADSIVVTVSDSATPAGTVNVTITVDVTAVNDAPTATAPTLTVAEDATVAGTSQIAVTDADTADTHTYAINTQGSNGVASVSASGLVSYTPSTLNYNGADSIVVTVSDSATPAGTVDVTITVDVTVVNDVPIAVNDAASVNINASITLDVLANDNDTADGDTLNITAVSTANGSITNNGTSLSYTAPATAGTDTFTYDVSDGNGGIATATVTVTVNDVVDLSGIWKTNMTVTSVTPISSGTCDSLVDETSLFYVTNTQSGSTVTVKGEEGLTLTGTVDNAGLGTLTGTFTSTEPDLSQPGVDGATNTFSGDISLATTSATTAGNMIGTITIVESFNGTPQCTVVSNMMANYVYKPTGSENYNGVYSVEYSEDREENYGSGSQFVKNRDAFSIQLLFDAAADADGEVQVITPPGSGSIVTSSTYDVATGFFSFVLEELTEKDWDGDGVIDDYEVITDNFSGIMLRDPAVAASDGAPHFKMHGHNATRTYSDSAHTNQTGVSRAENDIYGKLSTTAGYTRTAFLTNSDGTTSNQMWVGLFNAPIKKVAVGNYLYLQVMDGSTELCNTAFISHGVDSGRYSIQADMPHPDMATEAFRPTLLSSTSCDTNAANEVEQITFGASYTINVIDSGADGVLGGVDDTLMYTTAVTAAPVVNSADRYTSVSPRSSITVNGAASSTTMLGNPISLHGYFDYSEEMALNFTAFNEGADNYQVRIQDANTYQQYRYKTTGTSISIPASTLSEQKTIRVVATKADANGAKATGRTNKVEIKEGIRGFFNIELGSGVGETHLQVYLDGDTNGNVKWAHVTSNTSNFFCELMVIDTNTDVVTLTISDTNGNIVAAGSTFDLKLDFKSTGTITSGYAVVTSAAVPVITNASARAVHSEMLIRTFADDLGSEQTSVTMANVFDATNTYDDATFKASLGNLIVGGVDNAVTGKKMWTTGTGNTFLDKVKRFNGLPSDDGQPQFTGQYVTKKTGASSWNLGSGLLAAGGYKIVTKDSATGLKKLTFATSYSASSASAYVAPSLADMTINLTAGDTVCGTACTSATAVDVTADNGTWAITFVGSAPTGSLWQAILTEQTSGTFQEYRSPVMDPTVTGSGLVDNGNGTFTMTNNGIMFPAGITVKVQIRVMDQKGKASTIIGQTSGGQGAYMFVSP